MPIGSSVFGRYTPRELFLGAVAGVVALALIIGIAVLALGDNGSSKLSLSSGPTGSSTTTSLPANSSTAPAKATSTASKPAGTTTTGGNSLAVTPTTTVKSGGTTPGTVGSIGTPATTQTTAPQPTVPGTTATSTTVAPTTTGATTTLAPTTTLTPTTTLSPTTTVAPTTTTSTTTSTTTIPGPTAPPSTPSGFRIASVNWVGNAGVSLSGGNPQGTFQLSWTDASNNETGFRIYNHRQTGDTLLAEVGAGTTTARVVNSGVQFDRIIQINGLFVVAFNERGESVASPTLPIYAPTPQAPHLLTYERSASDPTRAFVTFTLEPTNGWVSYDFGVNFVLFSTNPLINDLRPGAGNIYSAPFNYSAGLNCITISAINQNQRGESGGLGPKSNELCLAGT